MAINQKMVRLGQVRSVIRETFEYGNRRKTEIGAENVYDFSLGNPSVSAPESVANAIRDVLANTDPIALHGYTSAPGSMQARSAIAASIQERFGIPSTPDCIYMTAGAAASLTISLKALLLPGEEVLVPVPYFPEYRTFIENAGGKLTEVAPDERMFPDLDDLASKLTPNVKAIILNSPNNPSGAVYDLATIQKLTAILEEKSLEFGAPIYLISDEPYRELVWNGEEVPYLPCYYDNTIVCYSYSKSLSLPGERIGYIALSPTIEDRTSVFAAVCGAGRSLGFVCAPSLFQAVVAKCTNERSAFTVYLQNRDLLLKSLSDFGYSYVKPDGAFYLFMKSPEPDAYAFCERATKYELLLVPADDFGIKGYVRISYCVSTDQIRHSLPAFEALAKEYGLI
jgi:aspartate aminotransferase